MVSRFTPTRVGKSALLLMLRVVYPVHPHTCGEITVNDADGLLSNGSPPHVWGNLNMNAKQVGAMRFTPTRVGKSYALGVSGRFYAVHPHTCGEISLSNERQN